MSGTTHLKRSHIIFLVAFVMAALGLKLWQYHWPTETIMLKGKSLDVLVAKTIYQQYRGLGKRDSLGKYDGMLFPFGESARHGFVMRDMRFPIDIVWFQNGVVVDIAPSVPIEPGIGEISLKVYYPRQLANAVLELRAGWASAYGLKIGDTLVTP